MASLAARFKNKQDAARALEVEYNDVCTKIENLKNIYFETGCFEIKKGLFERIKPLRLYLKVLSSELHSFYPCSYEFYKDFK